MEAALKTYLNVRGSSLENVLAAGQGRTASCSRTSRSATPRCPSTPEGGGGCRRLPKGGGAPLHGHSRRACSGPRRAASREPAPPGGGGQQSRAGCCGAVVRGGCCGAASGCASGECCGAGGVLWCGAREALRQGGGAAPKLSQETGGGAARVIAPSRAQGGDPGARLGGSSGAASLGESCAD